MQTTRFRSEVRLCSLKWFLTSEIWWCAKRKYFFIQLVLHLKGAPGVRSPRFYKDSDKTDVNYVDYFNIPLVEIFKQAVDGLEFLHKQGYGLLLHDFDKMILSIICNFCNFWVLQIKYCFIKAHRNLKPACLLLWKAPKSKGNKNSNQEETPKKSCNCLNNAQTIVKISDCSVYSGHESDDFNCHRGLFSSPEFAVSLFS